MKVDVNPDCDVDWDGPRQEWMNQQPMHSTLMRRTLMQIMYICMNMCIFVRGKKKTDREREKEEGEG